MVFLNTFRIPRQIFIGCVKHRASNDTQYTARWTNQTWADMQQPGKRCLTRDVGRAMFDVIRFLSDRPQLWVLNKIDIYLSTHILEVEKSDHRCQFNYEKHWNVSQLRFMTLPVSIFNVHIYNYNLQFHDLRTDLDNQIIERYISSQSCQSRYLFLNCTKIFDPDQPIWS